jgi:hypothetical protein
MRDDELGAAFADVWRAIPEVVFTRTLDSVQGDARLAETSLADEAAAALDATDKDVSIGGAGLAAGAVELGLVDELRMFRDPVVIGGGTPFLPPVTEELARLPALDEQAAEDRRPQQDSHSSRQPVAPDQVEAHDDASAVAAQFERMRVLDHDALHECQVLGGIRSQVQRRHEVLRCPLGSVRAIGDSTTEAFRDIAGLPQ